MANSHHTSHAQDNHPDLKYPGWHAPWVDGDAGASPDPLSHSIISHVADRTRRHAPKYLNVVSGEMTVDEAVQKRVSEMHKARADIFTPGWNDWAINKYTVKRGDAILWVCHPTWIDESDMRTITHSGTVKAIVHMSEIFEGHMQITFSATREDHQFPPHPDMPSGETWIYRMFDESGILLYIGISKDAFIRFAQHAKDKPWINSVARWERQSFPSRQSALDAEKAAIKAEHPLYNVVHNEVFK